MEAEKNGENDKINKDKRSMEKYELLYKINKSEDYLRLLGRKFVIRNKGLGHFIYKNKRIPLLEKIRINNIKGEKLKIYLIFYRIIYYKRYMFKDCVNLLEFSILSEKDNIEYSPIVNLFEAEDNCIDLFDYIDENKDDENTLVQTINNIDDFPDYSDIIDKQKNTKSSTIMKIYNNLKLIPNYTEDAYYLNSMFYNCSSLLSLSDISKWNISKVTDMSGLFYNCSSLKSLTDISKWDISKVTDISGLFQNCLSLKFLPDISKWSTNNVINMSLLFYNCSSLISLPDISKWNTNNITDINGLFLNCQSLSNLPNISIWNTEKLKNMRRKQLP